MGNGMNKVLPGLYVGNYRDSKDTQQLDKFQITHIVAIHDSPRRLLPDKHYLCVMAADTPDQNLSQYFTVCNDFIHAARLREGNVLIHCLAGMSRSVTVAVAYIMTATNLSWKDALKVVRAGRAVANPNIGFQTQLQEFEMYRLAEERRRLRERFPSTALEQLDRTKCMTALDNYEELLQNKDICEGNCAKGEKCPTGVCNMDPTKGLFRRRPSSASTRSRLKPQSAAGGITTAQSCPTSPKHSGCSQAGGSRRSLGEQRIPEDEEAHLSPTTSSEAAEYAAAIEAARLEQQQQQQRLQVQQQQQQQQQQKQQQQQQQQQQQLKSPTRSSSRSPRGGSAGSRLTGNINNVTAVDRTAKKTEEPINGSLQRSASTVSGLGVRPRSSPAGLYSYTGSVPSSRVDLRDSDRGSAIYLGCSAPRTSTLSLASSRGSAGSSAPASPARTPPVSPRHGVRRSASLVKKQR